MPDIPPKVSPQQAIRMLFLAGHGLQTPLSAIRWGSGRLKKLRKDAGADEMKLIDQIGDNARKLSKLLDVMLVLAKVEDGAYTAAMQEIYLFDFFSVLAEKFELPSDVTLTVDCPKNALIHADRKLFETVIQALTTVIAEAAVPPKNVSLSVSQEGSTLIRFSCPLELSLLHATDATDKSFSRQMVGGIPGLMLSIAHALSPSLGGTLEMREGTGGLYDIVLQMQS